jgi:hypothetical protein
MFHVVHFCCQVFTIFVFDLALTILRKLGWEPIVQQIQDTELLDSIEEVHKGLEFLNSHYFEALHFKLVVLNSEEPCFNPLVVVSYC